MIGSCALIQKGKPSAQTKEGTYPTYRQVARRLFRRYRTEQIRNDTLALRFAKKREGWVLQQTEFPSSRVVQSWLLWSAAGEGWTEPELLKAQDQVNYQELQQKIQRYYAPDFQFCPYFGYTGWHADVIEDFDGVLRKMEDTLLYGLGRAHSAYAANLLHLNRQFADTAIWLKPGFGPGALFPNELAQYRTHRQRAQACFGLLAERRPNFNTRVGRIGIKHHNEYMTEFLDVLTFQNESAAREALQPGRYNTFYRNLARNYLRSCPPNAVLFTHGDNDTYPLLYVQATEAVRTDVRVVNQGLLNSAPYVAGYYRQAFGAKGLALNFNKGELKRLSARLVLLRTDQQEVFAVRDLVSLARDTANWVNYYGAHYPQLPSRYWKMRYRGRFSEVVALADQPQVNWFYGDRSLRFAQLVLMDHLATERGLRPVCFTVTSSKDAMLGLESETIFHGLVYELHPRAEENIATHDDQQMGQVAVEEAATALLDSFQWSLDGPLEQEEKRFGANYLYSFLRAARAQQARGKTYTAQRLLDTMFTVFNNRVLPYNYYHTPFVELYLKLGAVNEGVEIAEIIIENMGGLNPNQRYPLKTRRIYIDRLKNLTREFGLPELLEKIKAFEEETGKGLPGDQ